MGLATGGGRGFPAPLFLYYLICKIEKIGGPHQLYQNASFGSIAKRDNLEIISKNYFDKIRQNNRIAIDETITISDNTNIETRFTLFERDATMTNTKLTTGNDINEIHAITFEGVVPSPIGTFGEARFDDAVLMEAEWADGSEVTENELDEIHQHFHDWVMEWAAEDYEESADEAYARMVDERWPF